MYDHIRGQHAPVAYLKAVCRSGKVSHAYLFTGPAGVGKQTIASAFAAALLCASPVAGVACGECRQCRLYYGLGHPDLHSLDPKESTIKIDQIRQLVSAVGRKPYHHRHVVIIDQAEKTTPEAQNAFLKTLEDPPGNTVFILISAHPDVLLPTVLSRCSEVRFGRLAPATVAAELAVRHNVAEQEAKVLAALSGGSIGHALELMRSDIAAVKERVLKLAQKPSLREILKDGIHSKREAEEWLEFLGLWYRDLLLYQITGDRGLVVYTDHLGEIEKATLPVATLLEATGAVEAARKMLRANVNPRLVIEGLFIRIDSILSSAS
ncbi:MAG: DNA polymerase III subunit delta' [Bacillota bacterium]